MIMVDFSPLVSVIIPVYNNQDYLDACIQSVLRQTYENIEIIVVNDGSTDNSLSIIGKYQYSDNRIFCVNKKNEGLPLARKSGIDKANGKYIQHLDSDDTLVEDAIERLVYAAETTNADIVAAPFYFCYQCRAPELSTSLLFDELAGIDYYREILNNRAYWSVWSNFQKRSLFLNYPIEVVPNISFGEDAILMTQLSLYAQKVVSITGPILKYNRYSTSMSYQLNSSKYKEFRSYQVWIELYLKKKGLFMLFEKELARMHIQTTFLSIRWKFFNHVKQDMARVIKSVEEYPDLVSMLSKREHKLLSYYRRSSLLGYLKLRIYSKKGKI